jgi:hypothetical protein
MKVSFNGIDGFLNNGPESKVSLMEKGWGIEVELSRYGIYTAVCINQREGWISVRYVPWGGIGWYKKGAWGKRVWEVLKEE